MRELLVHVPKGHGKEVAEAAKANGGMNLIRFEATDEQAREVLIVYVPNGRVETLIEQIQEIPELHVTLTPRGFLPLRPPASEAPEQVVDVESRSPLEVFLGGLQSVGSWKSFLGYAVAAGAVVWVGLFTNTSYLLVAAMLIAPFAGPAMNTAIATARGDLDLLRSSLLRYFAALAVSMSVASILSLVFLQHIATPQMVDVSQVSIASVLLPLAAGAAGALNLAQSERSSLVSGAAVGMLVAASLAPPAGLVGMASILGRWDLAKSGLFVLFLQLAGINFSGSLVFRAMGLSSRGIRYERGKRWVFLFSLTVTILLLMTLLFWQFSKSPGLQRSSLSQRAAAEIQKVVERSGHAKLVEANVRFTRPSMEAQNTLLGVIYVQRSPRSNLTSEEIRSDLTRAIQAQLVEQGFNVTPFIDVNVLEEPPGK
jgi:uncharacterized hydrophobic protein (TIGR00271 family)